ncbi:unnamed protein product [Rotaria sp. Silwood1]|nr:unnamed protein product [Rotaria sp. Silwood1]
MEPFPKAANDITNSNGEEQPSSMSCICTNDELDKILADSNMFPTNTFDDISTPIDSNSNNDQFDINLLIGSSNAETNTWTIDYPFDTNDIKDIIDSLKTESIETEQSIIIESNDSTDFYDSKWKNSPSWSVQMGNSPVEPKVDLSKQLTISMRGFSFGFYNCIPVSTCAQAVIQEQERLIRQAQSQKIKNYQQSSATVAPVEYRFNSGGCEPCTTVQMYNDFAYQQQKMLPFDLIV